MDLEIHPFIKILQEEWTCPISKMPILDPVVTTDGHTYERENIIQWLKNQRKAPKTGLELPSTEIIPNYTLKSIIAKLNSQLPGFLSNLNQNKLQIQNLSAQIADLKQQLQFQRSRHVQTTQINQKQTKIKKIQKDIYESKRTNLHQLRQQKNKYQLLYHEIKTQQQNLKRQNESLKQSYSTLSQKYEKLLSDKRKQQLDIVKIRRNRLQIYQKLKHSFASNLRFIGLMLTSIEETKKFQQTNKQKEQQINLMNQNQNPQNLEQISAIKHLENTIKSKLKRKIRVRVQNREELRPEGSQMIERPPRPNIFAMEGMRQRNRERLLRFSRQNIFSGLYINQPYIGVQEQDYEDENIMRPEAPLRQPRNENQIQNQIQPQANNLPQSEYKIVQTQSAMSRQLDSVKWLISKKNYTVISMFYSMQKHKYPNDSQKFWCGVKLSIRRSGIPFQQFLAYSWTQLSWLDLQVSHINNQKWKSLVQNASKFQGLIALNLSHNQITNITQQDLQKFKLLLHVDIHENYLTPQSIQELQRYKIAHPNVNVKYLNQMNVENRNDQFFEDFF